MRAVIGGLAVPAFVLLACAGGMATSVATSVYDDGSYITYTYTLSSDEQDDFITAFHVYAPIQPTAVNGWCDSTAWTFDSFFDDEIEASDIYWLVDTSVSRGIPSGGNLNFTIRTTSAYPTATNYVIEGYLGNWGIETESWAGWGTFVMLPSVPVPKAVAGAEPEPTSFAALLTGLGALALLLRRR
jgi:hypothetical protein